MITLKYGIFTSWLLHPIKYFDIIYDYEAHIKKLRNIEAILTGLQGNMTNIALTCGSGDIDKSYCPEGMSILLLLTTSDI